MPHKFSAVKICPHGAYVRKWIMKLCIHSLMELSPSWEVANCAATQELPAFYGIRRFITVSTRALHWSLPWARSLISIIASKSKSEFCYDRRSVGQSVLVSGPHLGPVTVSRLQVYWRGALSLTRGRVCRLQLLLGFASAVIHGSESRGLITIFYCLRFETLPNLEGQAPVFISPKNKLVRFCPQALGFLFVASYDSRGYGGGFRTHLHMGITCVF
jgi:hypothetical protein